MTFLIHLVDFPEKFIPWVRLTPVFYVDDAFNPETVNFTVQEFRYFFKKINDTNFDIYVDISAFATQVVNGDSVNPPLFLDFDMTIINEQIYQEVTSNRQ